MAAGLTDHMDDLDDRDDAALDELIHRADLDGLVRMIDDRCSDRDWDGLLRVRDRSRHAVATGRQLWPAATLAEYRLALLGEPEHVGAVLDETWTLYTRFFVRFFAIALIVFAIVNVLFALFLASSAANYMTGQVVIMDGGMSVAL